MSSASAEANAEIARRRLDVRGRVQGVGFRPFVYRLAGELGLAGHVGNDPRGAFIEVEGPPPGVAEFVARLRSELPPLAEIAALAETPLEPLGSGEFRILTSETAGRQEAHITPDTATCGDCLRELADPADRRHAYPFINCTNCGPRYSIIQAVPYDRVNTTMSAFVMCPSCQAEYDDPSDRRFHAQPNACGACGPRVWLADRTGAEFPGDGIRRAAEMLDRGRIVAVKGLGGFHLACRADDDAAVAELRRRKTREAKPLAVMVDSLETARRLAVIDPAAAEALSSMARPIVLVPKLARSPISPRVAPGSECVGLMLPYTPLHALLLAKVAGPLVMTSGNPSDEPLCRDNAEAVKRLAGIADVLLLHDRDIQRGVDDSVVTVVALGGEASVIVPLRRARGYVPAPIRVPVRAAAPVLAVGAELKSTVCVLAGTDAVVSEHLGDLTNPVAYRNFIGTVTCFEQLLAAVPEAVACDLHPDYASTRYARQLGLPVVPVQHHHAHVVSCMADNGVRGRVIGVACDGTGWGTDGTVWGCEVLACDEADFQRAGYLRPFPLLGGDAASIETWRPAAALLAEACGDRWAELDVLAGRVGPEELSVARARLEAPEARLVRTSSLGRLFDAVAFLLGVCDRNRCEAQAPMALEALAAECPEADALAWALADGPEGAVLMDPRPTIRAILADDREPRELAAAFHRALAEMLAACVARVSEQTGLRRVLLTGGCFANRLLLGGLAELLGRADMEVYVHRNVPPGDGGISLGQAVAAAARMEQGTL